ncbi:MAG: D-alanyl-lipoteichoic acid biosynthesis protein DltD [Exiguobacterium sp.]|nr:D-alanyl-lipoteichoic acid biosynthesis protein DltD [Exiguobacterium sp.]
MRRLIAALCVIGIFAIGFVVWAFQLPSEQDALDVLEDRPFQLHMSPEQTKDLDFVLAALHARQAAGDNTKLIMGSSEFSYFEGCSAYPSVFFGESNYGMDTMMVGNPWFQSLWHAIEVGALDEAIPDNKVAIFVSVQWFLDYQDVAEDYRYAYSRESLEAFLANEAISDELKDTVVKRASEYGVDVAWATGPSFSSVPDAINGFAEELLSRTEHVRQLANGEGEGSQSANQAIPPGRFSAASSPDWDALMSVSAKEGEAATRSNSFGMLDSYYENAYEAWLESTRANKAVNEAGGVVNPNEPVDFQLLLDVCKACEVEPLIIIMPVKGSAYDETQYTSEVRELAYSTIRGLCEENEVSYYDTTSHEYDLYYIRDVMHLGWTGWADIDRVLYDFYLPNRQGAA